MFNEISTNKLKSIVGGKMYKLTCKGRLKQEGGYGPWVNHTFHSAHLNFKEIQSYGTSLCQDYFASTNHYPGTGVGQGTAKPINGKGKEFLTNKFYF
ncbi:bacteriocin [Shewanella japonica]|uniref:bacteriocin n=1 Tax=Shewanella japonica TaxID=93973 RepID=UPI0024947D35|nr:bacteriocin [Shewanella japonica]